MCVIWSGTDSCFAIVNHRTTTYSLGERNAKTQTVQFKTKDAVKR
jgi:hypothetical protein